MGHFRPWTFVVSEYLDLPFLLRKAGEPVVSVRSAREALECLQAWCPMRVVIDTGTYGADLVLGYVRQHCPQTIVEIHDDVIDRLLVS